MNSIAINIKQVGKSYRIWDRPADRLTSPMIRMASRMLPQKTRLFRWMQAKADSHLRNFSALQDISFEVRKGESVGVIGRNGSGKSTLLQLIAGTLQPSSGSIEVNGRVAALLELGSGFNPDFTGKENVYLNGAVLGLTKDEVDRRFEAIAAFADIGDFMDQSVKTYSSGMQVRLGFAVAINVSADIVIIDEALAVGDMNFQAKCVTALRKLQDNGVSFLIVTHGTGVVKGMCTRGVYLDQGKLVAVGPAGEVADLYEKSMRDQLSAEIARSQMPNFLPTRHVGDIDDTSEPSAPPLFSMNEAFRNRVKIHRSGTEEALITDVELLDDSGANLRSVAFDQKIRIRLHIELQEDLEFNCGYHIKDEMNLTLLSSGSFIESQTVLSGKAGDRIIVELATALPLRHGRYSVLALISTKYIMNRTAQFVDWVENAVVFEMLTRSPQVLWAPVYLPNDFRIWHLKP